jgi:anti-sigma factor RsiW
MNCKKVLSKLNAYVDGELPDKRRCKMEAHFSMCRVCREQLEELEQVGERLDFLEVPSIPSGFASRVTARAGNRQISSSPGKMPFPFANWQPLRWFGELSIPMRAAAFGVIILALLLGAFMGKEITSPTGQQTMAGAQNMDELEWFGSTPPTSIGSAYLTLALAPTEGLEIK